MAEDVSHDWDNVGQTLARARAGRQDIVMAGAGDLDRIRLVFVEAQRLPGPRALPCPLLLAKYPAACLVQRAIIDQFVNPCPGFERRVELDQRLWP